MAKGNYYGSDKKTSYPPRGGSSIDNMAEQYIPAISKILLFEAASADDIKIGVEMIERLVKNNYKVTAHQIRNIFSLIQGLQDEKKKESLLKELHVLRPKLAYIGARQRENDGKIIIKVLDELIKSIDTKESSDSVNKKIKGLHYIMESIVAYHKFHSKN
jgi:CRISPR type III-A-associated protein Csm2